MGSGALKTPLVRVGFAGYTWIRAEAHGPGWRNWQTQGTQNPPGFGPCGFDSRPRHFRKVQASTLRVVILRPRMGRYLLRQVLRGLAVAFFLAMGVVLLLLLTDLLENLIDDLIDRVGGVWGLGVVGVATVGLGLLWLRHGGARVLRRQGVVLKPAPPDGKGSAAPDEIGGRRRNRLVGPHK